MVVNFLPNISPKRLVPQPKNAGTPTRGSPTTYAETSQIFSQTPFSALDANDLLPWTSSLSLFGSSNHPPQELSPPEDLPTKLPPTTFLSVQDPNCLGETYRQNSARSQFSLSVVTTNLLPFSKFAPSFLPYPIIACQISDSFFHFPLPDSPGRFSPS